MAGRTRDLALRPQLALTTDDSNSHINFTFLPSICIASHQFLLSPPLWPSTTLVLLLFKALETRQYTCGPISPPRLPNGTARVRGWAKSGRAHKPTCQSHSH